MSVFAHNMQHSTPPPTHSLPTGEHWSDKSALEKRWGASHQSYCSLNVSYFSNPTASALMGILSRGILWSRILSSTPVLESDNREMLSGRLIKIGKTLDEGTKILETAGRNRALGIASSGSVSKGSGGLSVEEGVTRLKVGATGLVGEAAIASTSLASELLRAQAMQALKHRLFCGCRGV